MGSRMRNILLLRGNESRISFVHVGDLIAHLLRSTGVFVSC
jgi:hypothetical protein